jgi:hypothetical protein
MGCRGLALLPDLMPGRGRGDRLPGLPAGEDRLHFGESRYSGRSWENLVPYPRWVDHSGGCILVYVRPGSRSCMLAGPAQGIRVPEAPPPGRCSVAGVITTARFLADRLIPAQGAANALRLPQLRGRRRPAHVLQTRRRPPATMMAPTSKSLPCRRHRAKALLSVSEPTGSMEGDSSHLVDPA